jgi:tetratricopeptide (TPR) repeat protein
MADQNQTKEGASQSKFESLLTRVRNLAVNTGILVAAGLILYAIFIEADDGSYVIQQISVPENFEKWVQGKDGVAAELRDTIGKLVRRARTDVAIKPVVQDSQQATEPEISVAGATFSAGYFVNALRAMLRKHYEVITGELSIVEPTSTRPIPPLLCQGLHKKEGEVKLILRLANEASGPIFEGEGPYQDVLMCGALTALRYIDPYSAAINLVQNDNTSEAGLDLVISALADARKRETAIWLQRLLGAFESDIPRGELARANILLAMGPKHYVEAKAAFSAANAEYAERHFGKPEWYAAHDGLATVLLLEKNYQEALAELQESLKWRSDYDSALYHVAEVYDSRSRDTLSHFDAKDTCQSLRDLDIARKKYRGLLVDNPGFAVAYIQDGIMLFQKVAFWKRNRALRCAEDDRKHETPGARDFGNARAELGRLEDETQSAFARGLTYDPTNPDAWFQWGGLLFQMQDPSLMQSRSVDNAERQSLLDAAISKYDRALELKNGDSYIWILRGEALATRAAITPRPSTIDYLRRAADSFCNSLERNTSDETLRNDARAQMEKASSSLEGWSCDLSNAPLAAKDSEATLQFAPALFGAAAGDP